MITEPCVVSLRGRANDVRLDPYILSNHSEIEPERRRPFLLILPGGGYAFRSFREDEPVAVRFAALGYSCGVLQYDVAPVAFPAQLLQALAAIHFVRTKAEDWHIDPEQIYVLGFSAGGHLAASAGVFWDKPHYAGTLGLRLEDVRPNGLILCYPVISAIRYPHQPSIQNVAGDRYDEMLNTLSLELQVSPNTPPAFIWHTVQDDCVPVENSLLFAQGLRQNGVPFELHLFEKGGHGLSLADGQVYSDALQGRAQKECRAWVPLADAWIKAR